MSQCEHKEFNTTAFVGRHCVEEGGPIVGFTVSFKLECRDCGVPFYFGHYPRLKNQRHELEIGCAPGDPPLEAPWVPGVFQCSKCMYRHASMNLSATTGAISSDRKAQAEKCPNCKEVMERVTWQQQASDSGEAAERFARRTFQLEAAWPADHEMPVAEDEQ